MFSQKNDRNARAKRKTAFFFHQEIISYIKKWKRKINSILNNETSLSWQVGFLFTSLHFYAICFSSFVFFFILSGMEKRKHFAINFLYMTTRYSYFLMFIIIAGNLMQKVIREKILFFLNILSNVSFWC